MLPCSSSTRIVQGTDRITSFCYNYSMSDIRAVLEQEMKHIVLAINEVSESIIENLEQAIVALKKHEQSEAKRILEHDLIIDEQCLNIEDACVKLLATQNPVAGDLRQILSYIHIASDLERIGDHTKYLARAITESSKPLTDRLFKNMQDMCTKNCIMLKDAIEALKTLDEPKAMEVAKQDNAIDELHRSIHKKIIAIMKDEPEIIEESVALLFLIRYFERIGDHVTNICESIVYAISGRRMELNT